MNKQICNIKYKNRGKLARYLKRDITNHVLVEETDGYIRRFWSANFHSYFTERDLTSAFSGTLKNKQLDEGAKAEREVKKSEKEEEKNETEWQQDADDISKRASPTE